MLSWVLKANAVEGEGEVDASFDPGAGAGATGVVNAVLPLSNGKLLVGGKFDEFDHQPANGSLVRLNLDGSVDSSFPGAPGDGSLAGSLPINALLLQPDGKILVGGPNTLYRIYPDGTQDTNFTNLFLASADSGPAVHQLTLQMNGLVPHVVVAFTGTLTVGEDLRTTLVRLDTRGNLLGKPGKSTFDDDDSTVLTVLADPSGDIFVGGQFNVVSGKPCQSLARLAFDEKLNGRWRVDFPGEPIIRAQAVRPDGNLLIGGTMDENALLTVLDIQTGEPVPEEIFQAQPFESGKGINAVVVLPDGRAWLGGDFTRYGGTFCGGLARITNNGMLDPTFAPRGEIRRGAGAGSVRALALAANGDVIVSGDFDHIGGLERHGIARLRSLNQAPQVTLASPTNGQRLPPKFTIPLVAQVADDRGVTNLVFLLDGKTVVGVRNPDSTNEFIGNAGQLEVGTYRLRATVTDTDGLETKSDDVLFEVAKYKETDSFIAQSPPARSAGSVTVNFLEPRIDGRWRFDWEPRWHTNGESVRGIPPGTYTIVFQPQVGYAKPLSLSVSVEAGANSPISYSYSANSLSTGSLTVDLQNLSQTNGVPPEVPPGARWALDAWSSPQSQPTLLNVPAGTHLVLFSSVEGWIAPDAKPVTVVRGQRTVVTGLYVRTACPADNDVRTPKPLTLNEFNNTNAPLYEVNGQLSSPAGLGSGVAVRDNVVLTAAHVIFDMERKAFREDVRWSLARMQLTNETPREPPRLLARGKIVLDGYATSRLTTNAPEAMRLDVATLWFSKQVARGGYSGYLVSQKNPSEWLNEDRRATLVGYPIAGCLGVQPGVMHFTEPGAFVFDDNLHPVYTTSGFVGFDGNSGGAVYVRLKPSEDLATRWFPAGIYLGMTGNDTQARVRVIDPDVLALINLAAAYAAVGKDQNGGVITLQNTAVASTNSSLQTLQVRLNPPIAKWFLKDASNMSPTNSGAKLAIVSPTTVIVGFTEVPGFGKPADFLVQMNIGQNTILDLTYPSPGAPEISSAPTNQTVNLGDPATFSVMATGTPPLTYQWRKDGKDLPHATTATLSFASVQEADAGWYEVEVGNQLGSSTSNPVLLEVLPVPVLSAGLTNGALHVFVSQPSGKNVRLEFADSLKEPLSESKWTAKITNSVPFFVQFETNIGGFYRGKTLP